MSIKKFKRILSLTLSISCMASAFVIPNNVSAETMNFDVTGVQEEATSISECKASAINQYNSQDYANSNIPGDYKVLFVQCSNVIKDGKTYAIADNSTKDIVFDKAVINYELSVESFAKNNVNIITEKKYITDTISVTNDYIAYNDIQTYLDTLAPAGYYDTVLVTCGIPEDDGMIRGVATHRAFNYQTNYGYAYISLVDEDNSMISQSYNASYPYLVTTNVAIHEWLHTLESYREWGIEYPYTHGYLDSDKTAECSLNNDFNYYNCGTTEMIGYTSDDSGTMIQSNGSSTDYTWKTYTTSGIEPNLTNFYRAVLCAEVKDKNAKRYVGMYAHFWKITPRKIHIGTYTLQEDTSGKYLYNDNGVISSTESLTNNNSFQWILKYNILGENIYVGSRSDTSKYFDISNRYVTDKCLGLSRVTGYEDAQTFSFTRNNDGTYKMYCTKVGYASYFMRLYNGSLGFSTTDNYSNWHLQKVNNDDGQYYIKNVSANKYLTLNGTKLGVSDFAASDQQKWNISYYDNGFYKINPSSNSSLNLDVANNYDYDGVPISLNNWTGYPTAQTWQFRLNDNGFYSIVPLVSTTRGLTYSNNNFNLTTLTNNSTQNWIIEKVDGGKMIFDGQYKIKNANNKYIGYSGNSLALGSTETIWSITAYDNNYYFISPVGTSFYWDVANNYDIQNNTVGLHSRTSYKTAQTWKFIPQVDGSVRIIPMLSQTRNLTFSNSSAVISTIGDSWFLEKVS